MKTPSLQATSDEWLAVEPYVESFEEAICDGDRIGIAHFLPPLQNPLRMMVLIELIRVDLEWSHKRGRPAELASYRAEFPEAFRDPQARKVLAFEDFRLRRAAGEEVDPEHYQSEFDVDVAGWPRSTASANVRGELHTARSSHRSVLESWPEVNDTVGGFKLLRVLGQGAFGKVFLGRQLDLAERPVVIKVTREATGESQRLASLHHTAIVPIYSVHAIGNHSALVMPFCGTATLAQAIRVWHRSGDPPSSGHVVSETIKNLSQAGTSPADSQSTSPSTTPTEIELDTTHPGWKVVESMRFGEASLWIAARLAEGLSHAHERGIVHRDLKPANILLSDDGQPMLLDFHLAADVKKRCEVSPDFVGGTFPYMAPEQIRNLLGLDSTVDPRSDIYSLGVVLYESLLGKLPYSTRNEGDWQTSARKWLDVKHKNLLLTPEVRRRIGPATCSILTRCLAAEPRYRYQSASELLEDLNRQLNHYPLRYAANTSMWERVQKWFRRHPSLKSMAAVVAISSSLLLAVGLMAAFAWNRVRHWEADAAFRESQMDLQTAFFAMPGLRAEPERDQAAREACERVENRYQILSNPHWLEQSAAKDLSPSKREALKARVAELLALWQRSLMDGMKRADNESERSALKSRAVQLSDAALACYALAERPSVLVKWRHELEVDGQSLADPEQSLASEGTFNEFLFAIDEIDRGKLLDAARRLERITRASPRYLAAWPLLGQCNMRLERYADAERALTTCISLWPDSAWAYLDRGLALKELGLLDEAEHDLTRALEISPGNTEAIVNRAIVRLQAKRFPDAKDDLDAAMAKAPESARLQYLLSQWYAETGDEEGAHRSRAEALNRTPNDEVCWTIRGYDHIAAGKFHEALHDFEQALKFNPWFSPARQNKAHVLAEHLGQTAAAIEELTLLLQSNPEYTPAIRGRGVLYARLGNRVQAITDAEHALLLDSSAPSCYQVGGIYATTARHVVDDRQEALRLLTSAFDRGYGLDLVDTDPELDSIRGSDDFTALVARQRARSRIAKQQSEPPGKVAADESPTK